MQPIAPEIPTKPAAPADLEIKDAQLIFNHVWKQLEADYGRVNLRFPKELILLGGAPGAGKGTNTDFIRQLSGQVFLSHYQAIDALAPELTQDGPQG